MNTNTAFTDIFLLENLGLQEIVRFGFDKKKIQEDTSVSSSIRQLWYKISLTGRDDSDIEKKLSRHIFENRQYDLCSFFYLDSANSMLAFFGIRFISIELHFSITFFFQSCSNQLH